jgi:hypothetical protein
MVEGPFGLLQRVYSLSFGYGSDNIFDHHFYSSTVRRLSAKTLFLRKLDAKDVSGQAAHVWKLRPQPVDRLTTTLITKLLTNQLAQSRPTADAGDQSPASGPAHQTARLSIA